MILSHHSKIQIQIQSKTQPIILKPPIPVIPLIRYIIALVRCDMSEVGSIIAMAEGKYADELDIPVSDVEEEYTEDPEQE